MPYASVIVLLEVVLVAQITRGLIGLLLLLLIMRLRLRSCTLGFQVLGESRLVLDRDYLRIG